MGHLAIRPAIGILRRYLGLRLRVRQREDDWPPTTIHGTEHVDDGPAESAGGVVLEGMDSPGMGKCEWQHSVAMVSGSSQWQLSVAAASGSCQWQQLVATVSANSQWQQSGITSSQGPPAVRGSS